MDESPYPMARDQRLRPGLDIKTDRWPDVTRLFAAAVGLDQTARDAYLDEACGNQAELRAAVDSLLAANDQAGSFGEGPVFLSETVKLRSTQSI